MRRFHVDRIWRFFLLQSSRNEKAIDGLGFFFASLPLIRELSIGGKEAVDVARRDIGYFNTHPFVASYVAGAIENLERRRGGGEDIPGEQIVHIKNILSSVLNARADYFFQVILIPLGLTIGSISAIYTSSIGLVIFLALYNYYHFRLRVGGYFKGVELGECVSRELLAYFFRGQGLLRGCAAFVSGAFAAITVERVYRASGVGPAAFGVAVVAVLILLRKRFSLVFSNMLVFLAMVLYLILKQ